MYNAEVLSKFPVVQHFPFGSLFSWEQDPNAPSAIPSVHTASQPTNHQPSMTTATGRSSETTNAPWAKNSAHTNEGHRTTQSTTSFKSDMAATRAPWATAPGTQQSTSTAPPPGRMPDGPTRAPWAKR
jgi:serine/threonine-protein phosphatase 2A activator